MKKCIYCGVEIDEESVIDFCDRCGEGVWGTKMLQAIKKNMEEARDNGTLCNMPQDSGTEEFR
jgi:uncharacterized UBP type Zn finger protein